MSTGCRRILVDSQEKKKSEGAFPVWESTLACDFDCSGAWGELATHPYKRNYA